MAVVGSEQKALPYGLNKRFEMALVALLCQRPKLFARIGLNIDATLLDDERSQHLLKAAQEIATTNGQGPGSRIVVVQHLHQMYDKGRMKLSTITACEEYLDEAEDWGFPTEDEVAQEIIPKLKQRAELAAVLATIQARKDGNLADMMSVISKAVSIGEVSEGLGIKLGVGSFDAIRRIRGLSRLAINVPELDTLLEGGLWRKALGVVMAPAGWGKSVYLSHQAAAAMLNGYNVAIATLELPEPLIIARLKANLLGMPIDSLLNGALEEAERQFMKLMPSLGFCVVKEFAPKATTVHDLITWVQNVEADEKIKIDLLVVDYADKLGSGKSDDSTYTVGGAVYEKLRHYAVDTDRWCWTASQPKRMSKGFKRIELDDVADSMHKVRVADMVLTITPSEEGGTLSFYLAKNRMGRTGESVKDLPHDFTCGRIAPVVHVSGVDADDYDSFIE